MKLGTRFVRVAAAGPPEAALGFVRRGGSPAAPAAASAGASIPPGWTNTTSG